MTGWLGDGGDVHSEFDGGRHRVYAANESGATSPAFTALVDYVFNTASPIVPGPPQIAVQPANVTVTEPAAASFSVTATGAAPWRINGGGAE